MVPDYTTTNTFTTLLRKLVRHHLTTEKNLDILCYFSTLDSQTTSQNCSWLPNLNQHLNGLCPQSFTAAGDRTAVVNVSEDLITLTATGLSLDRIKTVIGPFGLSVFGEISEEHCIFRFISGGIAFKDMQEAARQALSRSHPAIDPARLNAIFWNKLLGDKINMGQDGPHMPCPCGYLELWESLLHNIDGAKCLGSYAGAILEAFDSSRRQHRRGDSLIESKSTVHDADSSPNLTAFIRLVNRSFFVTATGMIGLGPPTLQRGDTVSILFGCNLPIVLRERDEYCEWIGPAYVYGAMDGEAVDDLEKDSSRIRDFVLR
jgi:hypothetical protein